MSKRKPLDVSELYDEIKKFGGTYALGADIVNFMKVNNDYGYAAGDIVIAEAFARIERELSENMLLFRTGGDEFAVITTYKSASDAEALARKITAYNGTSIKSGDHDIPLSLHVGISQIPEKALSYQKALSILGNAVDKARKSPDRVAVYEGETKA
ncbi:MAG: diguanylate cyclase [Oscillospiraceae bacterium]|nr:diguanylate cyclase [Oscillospiraceae bacterium]